jgi:hypothetical protein
MPLDLTTTVPRSPFDQLDGYAWLPRMIDKARAYFAGTQGEYTAYPCPGDKKFLAFFGIDAAPLGDLIKGGASDEAIAAWIKERSKRTPDDAAAYARGLSAAPRSLLLRLALRVMRRNLGKALAQRYPDRSMAEIHSFARMIALDEGHPIPGF